jgi:hypothetical protein
VRHPKQDNAMLPEYIIYDELKRQRKEQEIDERPQLEIPRYMPYWPEPSSDDESGDSEREHDSDVIIIQM